MTSPTVSIVIPCFNGGRFLPELFASLDAQTYRDFETIVVDDGSTDTGTLAILADLPATIRVVRQVNKGLAAARNTGVRAGSGAFVLPLDCDDRLDPTFLARTVETLQNAPTDVAFVFTDMRTHGGLETVLARHFNLFDQLFINKLPYCLLMRRDAWEQAGGYDETMREGYEDWEFNIRLARRSGRGLRIEAPLFFYFVSSQGMLMSMSAARHGRLWRRIRQVNADLFHPMQLLALHRRWAPPPRAVSLLVATGLLTCAHVLPDSLFGRLFRWALESKHRLVRTSSRA